MNDGCTAAPRPAWRTDSPAVCGFLVEKSVHHGQGSGHLTVRSSPSSAVPKVSEPQRHQQPPRERLDTLMWHHTFLSPAKGLFRRQVSCSTTRKIHVAVILRPRPRPRALSSRRGRLTPLSLRTSRTRSTRGHRREDRCWGECHSLMTWKALTSAKRPASSLRTPSRAPRPVVWKNGLMGVFEIRRLHRVPSPWHRLADSDAVTICRRRRLRGCLPSSSALPIRSRTSPRGGASLEFLEGLELLGVSPACSGRGGSEQKYLENAGKMSKTPTQTKAFMTESKPPPGVAAARSRLVRIRAAVRAMRGRLAYRCRELQCAHLRCLYRRDRRGYAR